MACSESGNGDSGRSRSPAAADAPAGGETAGETAWAPGPPLAGGSAGARTGPAATVAPGPPGASAAPSSTATPGPQEIPLAELGYAEGSEDAPVRIVEFSDFGCGYCRAFHEETYPVLRREFVETGQVHWKYVPFILGIFANAEEAALAGECAGEQGGFHAMADLLYENQRQWKNTAEPGDLFAAYAREAGLDAARFSSCVSDRARMERVASGTRIAQRLGIRGTPTFFIVGYAPIQGALPLETFREVLRAVLAERSGDGA